MKKKTKRKLKLDVINILVPIISVLILILSSLTLGIKIGFCIFFSINLIYFIPLTICKLKKKKTKANTKSSTKSNSKKKITNNKNNKNNKIVNSKKEKLKKAFKILLLACLIGFIVGIISIIAFFSYIVITAPEFNEELLYVTEPSVVLDKNGKEVAKLGSEKRIILTYDELPEVLIDAIVATEDSRFFEHKGVDWARFLKASFYQLLGQSDAGGASTLTMQVSKNAYTSNEATGIEGIIRKFTDVYVAMALIEKNYTKEQIMEFYTNSQWLGKNAHGVEQVSLNYFGKSAKEMNLAEAAMVAGLFQAPGRYDPYKYPEATEKRRQNVLKLMLRHGYISKDEYNIAKEMSVEKLLIPKEESGYSGSEVSIYQSFIDTVVHEIDDKLNLNPYTTPMTIYTTLDTSFQNYINDIMNGKTYNWENDVVQAGVAVLNVKDGSVAAIGGGRNVNAIDQWNYATEITKQIGSTAKPLYDYGPAVEYNNWSSYHILVDEPIKYSDGTSINNWNGSFEGFETMRTALKGSRNIPALKAFKKNDKKKVIEFVTNLGLTPQIYSCDEGYKLEGKYCINKKDSSDKIDAHKANSLFEAHSIGGYDGESPLTLASAYAAFANKGTYTEPYTFTKIVFQDTNEEYINEIKKTKAMSEETAYIITDMLTTTATNALGRYYNINGIRYAAKTGTTNYDKNQLEKYGLLYTNAVNDLWTVGYNTEYAIGVWYGYDNISSEYYNKLSSGQHNRLFQAVGKKIFTNKNQFSKPNGVVSIEVEFGCAEACLPSEYTPENLKQKEVFIKGTEPTTVSPRFEKLNDISNLKATVLDDTVTLTWDSVDTPKINQESYLKEKYSKLFENSNYLQSFIDERLNYNKSYIGDIGYNIYEKSEDGKLKLIDYVSTNEYKITIKDSGKYTYVIKTAYSIFKNNMSDGKEIEVNITIEQPLLPPISNETPNENNNSNSSNNQDNNTDSNTSNNQTQ